MMHFTLKDGTQVRFASTGNVNGPDQIGGLKFGQVTRTFQSTEGRGSARNVPVQRTTSSKELRSVTTKQN
jgi:hypothetical protein